jgi:preprotein translocase subunit SecD
MTTSRSDRRARRGTIARTAGWLAAGAMLATAALAPASVAAANPTSMNVACNNIVNGGRSPEYVWTTVGAAGVTANWATDSAHFDSANHETVTVRVCVIDANGADQGGIDQNTENDGVQVFSWSVLGYAADPCPDNALSFGSSVDSPAVQTKKSNMIDCPAADEPTDNAGDQPTDNAGDDPSDNAGDQPTDNAGDDPSDNAGDDPSDNAGDQPTDNSGDVPSDNSDAPTGAVKGIVGTPGVTPPPTDTQLVAPAAGGSDGWRIALVLMAGVLVGSLAVSQPRRARRRA